MNTIVYHLLLILIPIIIVVVIIVIVLVIVVVVIIIIVIVVFMSVVVVVVINLGRSRRVLWGIQGIQCNFQENKLFAHYFRFLLFSNLSNTGRVDQQRCFYKRVSHFLEG